MAKSKSSSKSRTSSSKKKNLKLKWWYVLPVVAIVAVAGYAIVRSSQASGESGWRTLSSNPPLICKNGTRIDKGWVAPACSITNKADTYARATWTPKWYPDRGYYGPKNIFCANVYFSPGAVITFQTSVNYYNETKWTKLQIHQSNSAGFREVCDWQAKDLSTYRAYPYFADTVSLKVTNAVGVTNVTSMYMK